MAINNPFDTKDDVVTKVSDSSNVTLQQSIERNKLFNEKLRPENKLDITNKMDAIRLVLKNGMDSRQQETAFEQIKEILGW